MAWGKSMGKSKGKYGSTAVMWNGEKFHSKKELSRYHELLSMEARGEISCLLRQVPYVLVPKTLIGSSVKYIADFSYVRDGNGVVEDVKAFDKKTGKFLCTPEFKIKQKLMYHVHGIVVELV
jgi:predicted phage-related endonuclease